MSFSEPTVLDKSYERLLTLAGVFHLRSVKDRSLKVLVFLLRLQFGEARKISEVVDSQTPAL
jgi:hypothetical protein